MTTADEPSRRQRGVGVLCYSALPTIDQELRVTISRRISPDGVIHLVSSRLHYRFNLAG